MATASMASAHNDAGWEIPGVIVYWFTWYAFYPDTEVYEAPR